MITRTPAGWAVPGNRWDLLDGVQPETPPSVSVIVAHYNQPAELARTLRALRRQDHPADRVEIIVVDDGSPEPPVVPAGVRLIVQPDEGFRLAAARNAGARAASNDVLVFLDADTAPEPAFLRELTRLPALSWDALTVGRRRHADFAAVPSAEDDLPVEVLGPQRELDEPRWLLDAYERSNNLLELDHRSYRFLIGAVLACSKRFFEETGGFDESFTQYGGEDWEWVYRAWLHGALIAHVSAAVAWHDGPDSAGRNDKDLAAKNSETLRLSHLVPVPGSRGRGISPSRADIVVTGPRAASTPGQDFVSRDSVLAELPGAVLEDGRSRERDRLDRFDRVRLEVVLEQPVRVGNGALASAVAAIESERYAEVVLCAEDGTALLRLVSRRAAARQRRWAGAELLPILRILAPAGVERLTSEVNLAAYLGGW